MNENQNIMHASAHFRAGFVNIVGRPNVGKSTLINKILGEKLSIVTPKLQTTRHRILGILNIKNCQIVFSDTPGIIVPQYALHQAMMQNLNIAFKDADIILWLIDAIEEYDEELHKKITKYDTKIILVINKIDLHTIAARIKIINYWKKKTGLDIIAISALKNIELKNLIKKIIHLLPKHPPYYPLDVLTDKPEKFFAAEIIREKIFYKYHQEIPYSTAVYINTFQKKKDYIYIQAVIYVESISQKIILIGKKGVSLKEMSISARESLEIFFESKVFLENRIKVMPKWRKKMDCVNTMGLLYEK